jgi:hypothetical protein
MNSKHYVKQSPLQLMNSKHYVKKSPLQPMNSKHYVKQSPLQLMNIKLLEPVLLSRTFYKQAVMNLEVH